MLSFIFKWMEANLNNPVVLFYFIYESYKMGFFFRKCFMAHFHCEGRRERFTFCYIQKERKKEIIEVLTESLRFLKSKYRFMLLLLDS